MVYMDTSSGVLCKASCHGAREYFKWWSGSGQLSWCTWILQTEVYVWPVVMVYLNTSSAGLCQASCHGVREYFKRWSMSGQLLWCT